MIGFLFSLFVFLVFVPGEVVQPVAENTTSQLPQQEEDTLNTGNNQQDQNCRYEDRPIPHRDLSDHTVEVEPPAKPRLEQRVDQKENESDADSVEKSVGLELEEVPRNEEEISQ